MKYKLLIGTGVLAVLLSISSCENFLDTTPLDKLAPVNYFENESQINYALTSVYDVLGRGSMYAYTFQTRFATEADEGFYYSTSRVNGPQFYDLSSSDSEVLATWTTLYEGIARANLVLENIKKPQMDETRRNEIEGEALFLRAYYYFVLVTNWGDVPLILNRITSVENNSIPRTPANDVYEQITQDMIKAESLVANASKVGFGGRVTKSAVRGILARVYLYWAGYPLKKTEKYADARDWAKKVMDDAESGHRLNPSYDNVFIKYARDEYDIKESIFEVEFATTGIYEHGQVGSWIGIRSSSPEVGTAYGFIGTTEKLYKQYEQGDLRRDRAISPFYYSGSTATHVLFPANQYSRRYPGKWRREEEVATPKLSQNTPINYPLLRFSDVLLMFAEADYFVNNQTPTTEAYEAINKVRRRGYGKYLNGEGNISESIKSITITNGGLGYTSAPTISINGGGGEGVTATATVSGGVITSITITNPGYKFSSLPTITVTGGGGNGAVLTPVLTTIDDADLKNADNVFLEKLMAERSKELCFEAMRKYDLIRWNTIAFVLNEMNQEVKSKEATAYKYVALSYANFNKDRHTLLPIPLSEMALNKALTQNPGY